MNLHLPIIRESCVVVSWAKAVPPIRKSRMIEIVICFMSFILYCTSLAYLCCPDIRPIQYFFFLICPLQFYPSP